MAKTKGMEKLEGMTPGGMNYLRARIQIWAVALIMILPLCLTSVVSAVRVGSTEAKSYVAADTTGMTDKEISNLDSSTEKNVLNGVWRESWFVFKITNWLLGSFLGVKDWGWSVKTCVDFLSWLFWLIVSCIIAIRSILRYAMLSFKLAKDGNRGKVETKVVVGYNLPFTGRGLLVLTIIACVHMVTLLGAPVWLTYLATLFVLHYEKRAFVENGGKLYDPERTYWLKEVLSELHLRQKIGNGLADTYGYEAGARNRVRNFSNGPLPSKNDYGDD